MRRLFIIAMVIALPVLAGCSDDSDSENAASKDACTEASARSVKQSYITNSAFDVPCIKVANNSTFFFINNDDTTHTVTTDPGAPEAFDAELPQKNSTYSHTFKTAGTYVITCKRHAEKMTLIVT